MLIGELIVKVGLCRPYVCMCVVCMSTYSNIFYSETIVPIEAKFHMVPPWDGGTKVRSCGPGHMTKMTAMRNMVKKKNKKIKKNIFFSRIKRLMTLKLGMKH